MQQGVFVMNDILIIFLIAFLGYILGSVKFKGLQLGTSGILLVALIFGHFGFEVATVVKNFGLICFVASVGFIAGPIFFNNFKSKALSYIFLGVFIIIVGTILTAISIKYLNIPKPLAIGIFTGALTSTPGLAAAIEATGSDLASIGYGIAYPFGVLGVVLFVQLIPKLIKADIAKEVDLLNEASNTNCSTLEDNNDKIIKLDPLGMLPFAASMTLGLLISPLTVPLPGGAGFNLGMSGGPLLSGLIFGHFGKIGSISIEVPEKTLQTLRELGLMLFLMGAGTNAGKGFVEVLGQYGSGLFLFGGLITLAPLFIGYFIANKILKLSLFNNLGSICGGMTSTPALGALITVAKTENVAASYAATYPIALICIVLATQFINLVF
jgi:putative transport protein